MSFVMPKVWVLTVDRPIQRFADTAAHLNSLGVKWERFNGFDNQRLKLSPIETFDLDRVGERIGPKHVAACLSHYLLWSLQSYRDEDSFLVLEYDARLPNNYQQRFEHVANDLPEDWQCCFVGSCCCSGRPTRHIKGDIYEVYFPLCGHAIWWRKSALPILLRECQRVYMPLDIHLFMNVLPKLRTYTVLPPLVTQAGTPLPP